MALFSHITPENNADFFVRRKPTEHFKRFCGSTCLDKNGLTSKKCVLDFIGYQIIMRNIKKDDTKVFMNDYLRAFFNTTDFFLTFTEMSMMTDIFVTNH